MPSEALSVRLSGVNIASNDNTEVQVVIYFFQIKYSYIDQSILGIVLQFIIIYEYSSCKSGFHQLGHIATTEFIEDYTK